jgi:PAS domain S-box-containing protein
MMSGLMIGQSDNDKSSRRKLAVGRSRKHLLVASVCDRSTRFSVSLPRVVLGVILCIAVHPAAAIQPVAKNVLVLHNWASLPQTWTLMESTVRARVPGQINFYVASIENPRFDEEVYRESMAETLHRGYGAVKFDVVVAATYPVLQFARQYRDKMFPGVPIVFTDVTPQEGQTMWSDVTGVISPLGMRETIDLALRLHPDTNTVAIITGLTEWDKRWLAVAHSELLRHLDRVTKIDLIGPADRQTVEKIARLPPDTVVLFQLRPVDFTHPAIDPLEILAAVGELRPTYSAWPGLALNRGGVGGVYRDLWKDAALNGEVVAKVLSGVPPQSVPIVRDYDLQTRVDSRALRRWHVQESALPQGTIVEHRQLSLWERDRKYILPAIVLIVAQALLILGLLRQRVRKRRAEAVLRESEKRFHVMADTTPSLVWMCDSRGEITYLNDRSLAFTGSDPRAGSGDTWTNYIHPADLENVKETVSKALETRLPFSKEYRLRRSDGVYRWMFDVASPRVNGDGSFGGFIGSAIDTTDQKLTQQALEKVSGQLIEAQEKERSRIARDLHDDICQRLALLSMELDQANRVSSGSPGMGLEEIRKHCSEIANDVQSLSHQLHSSKLDYLGIVAAIRGFCKEFSKQCDVDIEFFEKDTPAHFPKDASLCLFRVAQEALHNAVKHSGVRRFTVVMTGTQDAVQLVVSDTGKGFDVETAKENRGLGLLSMQERIHLVRGSFFIESKPRQGTRVIATVPLVVEDEWSVEDENIEEAPSMTGTA